MPFTKEIDNFLKKHHVDEVCDAEIARSLCKKAADSLKVDLSLMSCFGDQWTVVDDGEWWENLSEIRLCLGNKCLGRRLFVFFKGYPKNRVIEVELGKLLEMMADDDFFYSIFSFDKGLENALFDDHSGLFCGVGCFSDALQKCS